MAQIKRLPPTLVNQIAAGEVVERPASVVKELLENAVDAGSKRIDVVVAQGGIDLIQVVDDGSGIPADDLPLAFASHATSKLATVEDLFNIGTLGFRGEALASIGSIAQVKLQSRPAGEDCGAEITCHGGELGPVVPWNGAPGTRIEVRHLFFNTPARRKFLKGASTEMAHVSEVFTRLALAHFTLHWTLRHNGRLVYEVPGSMGMLDRIGLFFGSQVQDSLYMVEAEAGRLSLGGYIADPSCDRSNAQLQYLFVNGRWVRDRALFQAVQDGYRGLLMSGRYAVAFLFIEAPPGAVDFNVHPTKAEVRFRDREAVYQLVHEAVRQRLQEADLTARMQLRTKKAAAPVAEITKNVATKPAKFGTATIIAVGPTARLEPTATPIAKPSPLVPPVIVPARQAKVSAAVHAPSSPVPGEQPRDEVLGQPHGAQEMADMSPSNVMQVLNCYLVVEVPPDEVLFIDQHALHERILFEQLQQRLRAGAVDVQRLLIPETVSLSATQAASLLEHREALADLGLLVEDFGNGTVLVSGYPAIFGKQPPKRILEGVIDYLVAGQRLPPREQLLHDLLSVMACQAAVRDGDRLTQEQIACLLAQRELAQNSHHCPHGRPTSLRFSRHDLEQQFRRT